MIKERILVLCVDRDDDLGKKVKKKGPIIGREANTAAATDLMMKDPEDTDGNAIFQAVKVYDEMRKKADVQIVTITGDERLGYGADKKVTQQLEKVLSEFPADSCIFVSDGADDEEILPIVSSRVKINSKKTVVMRQAKELEKTYIVLLNKLKEPYYARLIFGIPALILLAFVVSEALGFGWRPIIALLGLYLLVKGFGVEESIIASAKSLVIPARRIALVVYLPVVALAIIALSLGVTQYYEKTWAGFNILESVAFSIKSILLFVPFILILIFIGKIVTLLPERKKFEIIDDGFYAISGILVAYVGYMACAWIVGDAWFSEFILATLLSLLVAAIATEATRLLKVSVASKIKLENKEVITEAGAYVGKVVGIDKKHNLILLQTPLGHKISIRPDTIIDASEKVIIKR